MEVEVDGGRRDVGDHAVLADCAVEAGLPRQAVMDFLAGDLADKEMRAGDQAAPGLFG